LSGLLTVLPAPAPLATGPLTRIGTDRVRCVRQADGSWAFNYSITKLDAPDLGVLLHAWSPALIAAVRPLRVSGVELTFSRPLPEGAPVPDAAAAFGAFARDCAALIDRVAPRDHTTIRLFWSPVLGGGTDVLDDWRLDLDPVRDEVRGAVRRLYAELGGWVDGLDRLTLNLEHPGV
jgi:hypothetical protein